MKAEKWLPVAGYEGRYLVSDKGRVKSLPNKTRKTELIMKTTAHPKSGHLLVTLTRNVDRTTYKQTKYYVHHLVLIAFTGPRPEGLIGCHDDGVPTNNKSTNLRWDTNSSNQMDRVTHGTSNRGAANGQVVLTEESVRDIKRRLKAGETQSSIAAIHGVSRSAILQIKRGKNWSWI